MENLPKSTPKKCPEPAVGVLILHPLEQKILLLKSERWENQYRLPRGHITIGESVEEAIKRVAKEEVGMDVEILEMILLQESIFSKEFTQPRHFIFLDFLVKAKEKTAGDTAKTDIDYIWVEPYNATDYTMNDSTRATVDAYLRKIRD
ncbi:MAG: NUDIX domain-containing protein [Patescibacteria group bacterium]|nr:NUDIX domain-containing protein [Patescibacteria group bacterium]